MVASALDLKLVYHQITQFARHYQQPHVMYCNVNNLLAISKLDFDNSGEPGPHVSVNLNVNNLHVQLQLCSGAYNCMPGHVSKGTPDLQRNT